MVILGTQYADEMKKGVFTIMNYLMPLLPKRDLPPADRALPLHASANIGPENDVSIFFGLSGTGKTTLSADPKRELIGDDEHVWHPKGVFNIEGGCYAKCIGLTREKEPEIYDAIRFGSILENVVFDEGTGKVDYDDVSITENTRVAYPLKFIPNARIPAKVEHHPKQIILLTCDAFGVLPPISKLTKDQVQPISFRVPRKTGKEIFQAVIYPDTDSGRPAMSADEYKAGKNGVNPTMSMDPAARGDGEEKAVEFTKGKTYAELVKENEELNATIKSLEKELEALKSG